MKINFNLKMINNFLLLFTAVCMFNVALGDHDQVVALKANEMPTFLECKKPKSKIYDKKQINTPIEFALIADRSKLNKYSSEAFGVAAIKTDDIWDYIPVKIKNRGNSRGDNCELKPFFLIFLDKSIEDQIKAEIPIVQNKDFDSKYLKEYYDKLTKINIPPDKIGKRNSHNIFKGLSNGVKIVSHCGNSTWEKLSGKNVEEQTERVLQEYYLYKIIAQFNPTVEYTQLASVTYFNKDGSLLYNDNDPTRIAFFREPKSSIAKRCNLTKYKRDIEIKGNNTNSIYANDFTERLAINFDYSNGGHNTNLFVDQNAQKIITPYDFDLSGIYQPDYGKNLSNLKPEVFVNYLTTSGTNLFTSLAMSVLTAKEKIQKIVEESLLNEKSKDLFRKWIDGHIGALANLYKDEYSQYLANKEEKPVQFDEEILQEENLPDEEDDLNIMDPQDDVTNDRDEDILIRQIHQEP